ncbi:hypothetical protein Daesc_005966 [Daldinia eschscholtzii]|uniref:Polyketide synthase n=1 Tax=Daldinia eschscholtzii TaxID=292717 RepID=A0AAX6MN98_9PEZI
MDPQQRILLEIYYEALESAGCSQEAYTNSQTAVYAAIFGTDYERNLCKDVLDLPVYQSVGTGTAILANRISHALDLHGPSVTLDTGCSGGLVALHYACQSLRSNECYMALAASANLQLMPDHYIEGFAAVVVKRLSDALRDRDPIRAVIVNSALNQDGHTSLGITHPNRVAQADLIRETYDRIGLWPEDVAYVEAHGTGTVAGDHEELAAIANVFTGPGRSIPLFVGSNKGNIGHTESTSSLASLLKGMLILDRGVIPPVAGFITPKPGLPLDQIHIPTKNLPWPENVVPRLSINSFGYGGVNAHIILDKGMKVDNKDPTNSRSSLISMLESHADWIEKYPDVSLVDLSYTLSHRRSALPWRFSSVATNLDTLLRGLRQGLEAIPNKPIPSKRNIIFTFTGQGAQWAGMGRELFDQITPSPIFRDSIRASRDILKELGATWDLEMKIFHQEDINEINKAEIAQPATTALQIALVTLLRAQGVYPSVVVGHSSGEIAAAYAAGRLSHRTALLIAFHLSGDVDAIDEVYTRIVALGDETFCRKLLVDTAYHSHHMRAVADENRERLGSMHSFQRNSAQGNYCIWEEGEQNVEMISSVTGLPCSDFSTSYWIDNLVSPVRFSDAIQKIAYASHSRNGGHILFLEIGPHASLAGPVRQCLVASNVPKLDNDYLSALQRGTSAIYSMLIVTGRLFDRGVKIKFDKVSDLSPGYDNAVIQPDLRTYAWDHSIKHWHESRLNREYRMRRGPYHDLLGVRMTESTSIEPRWRHMVCLNTLPWLGDHVIDGLIIFPGAGYICMVIEAIMQLAREHCSDRVLEPLIIRDISFFQALVVPDAPQRVELQLSFKRQSKFSPLSFSFSISALSANKWHEHCAGFVEGVLTDEVTDRETEIVRPLIRQSRSDMANMLPESFYEEIKADGNAHGPSFRGLRSIMIAENGSESEAMLEVPHIAAIMPAEHQEPHIIHPATLDIMFHVGIPILRREHGAGSVMPVHINELLVSAKTPTLSSPGIKLNVLAKLTSSQFRASNIDMTVLAEGRPVLSASGIESRSLVVRPNGTVISQKGQAWRTLLGVSALKVPIFLALVTLTAISAHGGTIATYDFVDITSDLFDEARRRLAGHPDHYYVLDPEKGLELQGFVPHAYEVVLASSLNSIVHASKLLKRNGLLILVLKPPATDSWQEALQENCPTLNVQLTFSDVDDGNLVIVMRNLNMHISHLPSSVRILTHSSGRTTSSWATSLVARLSEKNINICQETLSQGLAQPTDNADTCIIMLDDLPQPILSDEDCFEAAIAILQQSYRIIWISPAIPPPIHQITGVARTAHAENDRLRLITIHASPDVLKSSRLANLIPCWLSNLADQDSVFHQEREYQVRKDEVVFIPRLRRSKRMNRAISSSEPTDGTETGTSRFVDAARPLVLSPNDSSRSVDVAFVDSPVTDFTDTRIEIQTQAFVLSKPAGSTGSSLGEYAGVVRRVGKAVEGFVPGDAVVAFSPDGITGHNYPMIPSRFVSIRPKGLSPAFAAALFFPSLVAIYALRHLASLPEGGVVLIHGALSDNGRAAVSVARFLGADIIVTAADAQESLRIVQQLGIRIENVMIAQPSLLHPQNGNAFKLDAVVHISDDPIPSAAWTCLKPFGHIICYLSSSAVPVSKLPRNATVYLHHISDILREHCDRAASLVKQAITVLEQIPVSGFNPVIYDVTHVSEAHRLLRLGVYDRIVLQAGLASLVRRITTFRNYDGWSNQIAAYVVAGGLGDLGQRLLLLMARRGAMHLVTLSRRAISHDEYCKIQAQLELTRPGCRLHCLVCDITSARCVQDASGELSRLGASPVRGVIQSSGFLRMQDRTLETMKFNDFQPVTLVKVEGTLALEKVFSSPHLDFFLMLSSAVSITGASRQANYNAGNAVQDSIPHTRPPGFISLNIGWIEDAVHTSNDKTRHQGLWRTGLRPISRDELSRYFDYLLGAASSHSSLRQAVIGFDEESLSHTSARNSNVQSALFYHVRSSIEEGEKSSSIRGAQSFEQLVEDGDLDAMVDYITKAIAGQLTTLISIDATRINERDGSIIDLGLDSLVAIELRNWITHEFDAPLQSSEIMTDQPIRDLAQKVASRSRMVLSNSGREDNLDNEEKDIIIQPTLTTPSPNQLYPELPALPLPGLEDILQLFEESRRAIDTIEDCLVTAKAVLEFLEGPGPILYQQIREAQPNDIADAYRRQVYLERREPLPETGQFTFIHSVNAPTHSQATRATILTVAAINFARSLANGEIGPDILHGKPLTSEGRDWLFHATRRPGLGVDRMERYTPNHTVAVLRRGNVFRLTLPESNQPLHLPTVYAAYESILKESEQPCLPVCTLTADERDSWALLRKDLESNPENTATLSCIDTAAFVMCLDESSPTSSGERYTQFLVNGKDRFFNNRWLDKTLQLSVTTNGLSAETYEHTMIDGLDARMLHAHLIRAIQVHQTSDLVDASFSSSSSHVSSYTVHKHVWNGTPAISLRIERVWAKYHSYGPLSYYVLKVDSLGLSSLRGRRSPPNATAHLTVLIALYLVDGEIRPAWEKVSLGTFKHGRVEWVQTVLRETRALRGAAQQQQQTLPALFNTRAWDCTRRGGPGEEVRIGFMRFNSHDDVDPKAWVESDNDSNASNWAEAGFLVNGERGVYVHCNVLERYSRFSVSGKPAYVAKVCKGLDRAVKITADILA